MKAGATKRKPRSKAVGHKGAPVAPTIEKGGMDEFLVRNFHGADYHRYPYRRKISRCLTIVQIVFQTWRSPTIHERMTQEVLDGQFQDVAAQLEVALLRALWNRDPGFVAEFLEAATSASIMDETLHPADRRLHEIRLSLVNLGGQMKRTPSFRQVWDDVRDWNPKLFPDESSFEYWRDESRKAGMRFSKDKPGPRPGGS